MKEKLERLAALHEALIEALDANDVGAIERSSQVLNDALQEVRGADGWRRDPELKLAAERVAGLAHSAMMRINLLADQTRRRAETLAELRGTPVRATYGR